MKARVWCRKPFAVDIDRRHKKFMGERPAYPFRTHRFWLRFVLGNGFVFVGHHPRKGDLFTPIIDWRYGRSKSSKGSFRQSGEHE